MTSLRSTIGALIGVLALAGIARAQQEVNELPEGIRQLIRNTAQAEQQVRRENGAIVEDDRYQNYRRARSISRGAIRDYWTSRFAFDPAYADADAARRDAAEAENHLLTIQRDIPPNPARMQAAQEDRDSKFSSLATSEYYLEVARKDLEAARNPGGTVASGTRTNVQSVMTPGLPGLPVPDYGNRQPGSTVNIMTPESARRFAYRSEQSSYHLLGQTGTAAYSRGGRPQLTTLEFVKEREHFYFYRPQSGDPSIIEWAFAKFPEVPAGGGEAKFAVWCHDREGWHWEWARRDAPVEILPQPGPIGTTSAVTSRATGLLAGERPGAN